MTRRLLYAPINEPGSEQYGLPKAFGKRFEDMLIFDYRAMGRSGKSPAQIGASLYQEAMEFQPDIMHLQVQTSGQIPPQTIIDIKRELPDLIVSHWQGDIVTEVPDYLSQICAVTDLTLISSTGQIETYQAAGADRCLYWQVGVDPEEDVPDLRKTDQWQEKNNIKPIIYTGNHYETFPASQDRLRMVKTFLREFPDEFEPLGNWPTHMKARRVPYREQKYAAASSLVTLGMNQWRQLAGYYSDRTPLALAAGSCHLLDYVPGIEEEYKIDEEILCFRSIDEAVSVCRDLLADPGRARAIGKAGQQRVLEDHTWDRRVDQYLEYLEQII